MIINLLVFGSLAEVTGTHAMNIQADITNTESLHQYLLTNYPGLRNKKFQVAVNQNLALTEHPLNEGDEVALLPPFSGG